MASRIHTKEEIIALIASDRVLKRKFLIHDTYAHTGEEYPPDIDAPSTTKAQRKELMDKCLIINPVSKTLSSRSKDKLIVFTAAPHHVTKELHGLMNMYGSNCVCAVYGELTQTTVWLDRTVSDAKSSKWRMQSLAKSYKWVDDCPLSIHHRPSVMYEFISLIPWYDDKGKSRQRLTLVNVAEHIASLSKHRPDDLHIDCVVLLPQSRTNEELIELLESIECSILIEEPR